MVKIKKLNWGGGGVKNKARVKKGPMSKKKKRVKKERKWRRKWGH